MKQPFFFIAIVAISFYLHCNITVAQWVEFHPAPFVNGQIVDCMTSNGNYLFAGASEGSDNTQHYLIRSSDNGTSWMVPDSILPDGLNAGYVYALAAFGGKIFAGFSGQGILCSSDNGLNWVLADSGIPYSGRNDSGGIGIRGIDTGNGKIFASFVTAPLSQNYLIPNYFSSSDTGISWIASDAGLSIESNGLISCIANRGDTIYGGTFGNGIYYSTNNGELWSFFALPNKNIQGLAIIKGLLFASTSDSGIVRSSDNGITWNLANNGNGLPLNSDNNYQNALLVVDNILFALTESGVYYTRNYGEYWNTLDSPDSEKICEFLYYYNNYLFTNGRFSSNIARRPLSDYMHPKSAISLLSDSIYFNVSQGKGTYDDTLLLTNLGDTTLFIDSVSINDKNIGISYLDTAGAGGQIQIIVQLTYAGQPDTVKELIIASNDPVHPFDTVYVIISSKTAVIESAMPESFGLNVYPNPFSSSSQLQYSVAHEGNVSLTIVNEMGAIVATLVNGRQTQGVHTAVLDGGALPAGAYFARYVCGAAVMVKPVVMMR